ncbi:acyl-CoA dehydrogenase family protein [Chelatococcus reniformis]|uniref:Pimeloyl-CoA dehydrogenase small subunit n=1 Tax=Chelatococcus reniformis TaxID=1494448 RepID=A0A916X8G3_9HYPH|nr:acyl-CoA dehydrogenase family protein [Chelatococcus reniformis]GGC51894.1 pimeloyl-CoA dehydrogenase small subunit [Chelatococcus reniformis]
MDFDLTDEQRLLKDSVDRLVADRYDFEARNAIRKQPEGFSRELWAQYAELGILGLPFAEEDGGFGGGAVETMIVMEALGRALALEPYVATVILAGGVLRRAGSAAQRQELVPQIAGGERLLALAHGERQARYNLADVATTAQKDGDGWVLHGTKSTVLHGDAADTLIVSARVSGGQQDADGVTLFLVPADAAGLSRRGYPTQDAQRAADITLANVRVGADAVIGAPGQGIEVVRRVVDETIAALCAEAVGAMEATLHLTVDYLKTRTQFGRPIGNFQTLQHQSVDIFVALEQARSMTMYATMMARSDDAAERARAVAAAKVQIGRSGRLAGQKAIQLHGGVGMTQEYKVGHYFKRLTIIDLMFGDADHHLAILAQLGGLIATEKAA